MKKLLSLALAVAMILSMASMVFAATTTELVYAIDSIDDSTFYKVRSKEIWLEESSSVAYGNTIYFLLLGNTYDKKDAFKLMSQGPVTKAAAIKSVKIDQDWDLGSEWISSVSLVKKKFGPKTAPALGSTRQKAGEPYAYLNKVHGASPFMDMKEGVANQYCYFLAISVKSAPTRADAVDVAGEIFLKRSSGDNKINRFDNLNAKSGETQVYNIGFTVEYIKGDSALLVPDGSRTFIFGSGGDPEVEEDEEAEFTFDKWEGAYLIINTYGQGKVVLKATTDYNSDIGALYPDANLDFYVGNGGSFNKTGEMFLPAEEGSYIYELKNGVLVAIPSAEYDEYEEGFFFRTRTLGTYVISDVELDLAPATSGGGISVVDPGTTAPVVTVPVNPGTGAAA